MRLAIVRTGILLLVLSGALFVGSQTTVTIPEGTRLLVRMVDSVDSSKQQAGHRFTASLETNLEAEGLIVAPKGTTVYGRLTEAQSAGRMSGGANLTLELTDLVINGSAIPITTSSFEVQSKGKGEKTARRIVGGAGLGALIGGIAGGGTGAAVGVLTGGAVGTAASAATEGQQVKIASESLLEFRLAKAVALPPQH